MTLIPGLAAAVVLVWALGGDLGRVTSLRFRRTVLLYAALAGQLVAFGPVRVLPDRQLQQMQLATYVLLLAFCLANRRVAGLWLVAVGIGANALVIAANGGVMPVEPSAILASGWTLEDYAGAYPNVVAHAGAPLWFFGDVFAMPRFPGSAVLSVGDLSIIAGAWLLLQRAANLSLEARRARPWLSQAVATAAGGPLLLAALALVGAREALVVVTAVVVGASLAPVVLAMSGRRPSAMRCLPVCFLLVAGALALARSTTSAPTAALGAALAGLIAAICALTAAALLERAPTGLSG